MLPAYQLDANRLDTLAPFVVCDITYCTRTWFDYEAERGIVRGYWDTGFDTWGKFTIQPVDGSCPLYLFADEIVEVEAL